MNFKKNAIHIIISPRCTVIAFLLCVISIVLGFFLGSRGSAASLSLVNSTIQKAASANQLSSYAPTEFPGSGAAAVYLYGIDDVELQIGSRHFSLLSALSSGKLSSEDVVHQAFWDAAQGLCNRTEISRYGLSRYRFHYPNFELCITRDVFESATGGKYPIFSIAFYLPGEGVSSELEQYLYAEDGTMVDTRAEDWGLQFSVEEAGAKHILLNVVQKKGQQIGTLTVKRYHIYRTDGVHRTEQNPVCTADEEEKLRQEYPISSNAQTDISLDWEKLYGSLPSGDYELHLMIEDVYDKTQPRSPLQQNYTDTQRYVVPFHVE